MTLQDLRDLVAEFENEDDDLPVLTGPYYQSGICEIHLDKYDYLGHKYFIIEVQ